eukprot:scaffold3793_cov397-Prasinococcus_capsulatus_cf.AAC.5
MAGSSVHLSRIEPARARTKPSLARVHSFYIVQFSTSKPSSQPMAENGTIIAPCLAANRTNSGFSGQNNLYSSPFLLQGSKGPKEVLSTGAVPRFCGTLIGETRQSTVSDDAIPFCMTKGHTYRRENEWMRQSSQEMPPNAVELFNDGKQICSVQLMVANKKNWAPAIRRWHSVQPRHYSSILCRRQEDWAHQAPQLPQIPSNILHFF